MHRTRALVFGIALAAVPLLLPGTASGVTLSGAEWQSIATNSCQFTIWYAESGGNLHPGTLTAGGGQYCSVSSDQYLSVAVADGEGDVLAAKGTEGLPGGTNDLGLGPVGAGITLWSQDEFLGGGQGTFIEFTVQLPAPTAGELYTVYAHADNSSNCEFGPCDNPPPPPVQPHAGDAQEPYGDACWESHPSPQIDTHCDQQLTVVGKGT